MGQATSPRKTAQERREAVLDAAMAEFAAHGLDGASSDTIARHAGISQPYLFRLFGTKKELFIATTQRCMDETFELFRHASQGLTGREALAAMGAAYTQMITTHSDRLRGQMQAYSACDDPEIREVVQRGYGRLVEHVEGLGLAPGEVSLFFARGMLINVIVAMGVGNGRTKWARRLMDHLRDD